ncbi:MAG: DMT family transporter [Alphaproteobacteria bacterium]|nr:DMT family transporter [Alphaproteobacteria bacterium]
MGLLNNFVPFNLIVYGQTFIDSGLASIFNATTPFFAVALAFFLARDEDIGARKLGGVIIGVAGVSVLFGIGAGGMDAGTLFGGAMVMAGSFSYALAGIFGRRFGGLEPEVSACGMLMFATLLCVGPAMWHDGAKFAHLSWSGASALVGIAGLSTAFAYILYFKILKMAGAVNLLLVTLLIPVSATLLGVAFLGESVGESEVLGMTIIGIGLLVVDGRILGCFLRRFRQFRQRG